MRHIKFGHTCGMAKFDNRFIVMVHGGQNFNRQPIHGGGKGVMRDKIVQNSVELFDIINGWTWVSGML